MTDVGYVSHCVKPSNYLLIAIVNNNYRQKLHKNIAGRRSVLFSKAYYDQKYFWFTTLTFVLPLLTQSITTTTTDTSFCFGFGQWMVGRNKIALYITWLEHYINP